MGMKSGTGSRFENARAAQQSRQLQRVMPRICRFYVGLGVVGGLALAMLARAAGCWWGR